MNTSCRFSRLPPAARNCWRVAAVAALGLVTATEPRAQSQWVHYGQSGLLQYQLDSRGDRILDFSSAGYRGGTTPPSPDAVVSPDRVVTLAPVAGDNRARIQAAIDQVSGFSLNANGFRGIVNLTAGEFSVSDTLNILQSGVIIRGAGDGASPATNTIVRSTSTSRINVFEVNSPSHNFHGLNAAGSVVSITDKVVPAGASSFRVSNPGAFRVGDAVNVYRDAKQSWLDTLDAPSGWDASDQRFDHQQERAIVRIEGDRLFLDAPLAHSIDARESTGTVYRYTDRRVENVGFEGLRGVSVFNPSETQTVRGTPQYVDEDHADTFISFTRAKNGWARDVTGQHFINSTVSVNGVSRSITISDAASIDPVSLVTGSRRYSFNFNGGQFALAQNLTADQGRHSFVNNSTFNGFNRGPNVFLNAVATNSFSESGSHNKYSTGTLYDNVTDSEVIAARYSPGEDANHGWTGANHVFWNSSTGAEFKVFNPPGARNFLIGSTGAVDTSREGTNDSLGQRVTFSDPENPLDSLYVAQRLERERFPQLQRREYVLGDFDEFEYDGPASADAVYVDPVWRDQIDNLSSSFHSGQAAAGFDEDTIDRKVPFSFLYELGSDEEVVAATLTIATKRFSAISDNDLLWIDSPNDPLAFDAAAAWGPTYDGNLQVLSIEFVGELGFLQDGLLNAVLSDDRPVDWAQLELVVGRRTTVPGDHNRDGFVDAADYTIWRDTKGSTTDLRADANRNGVVDQADHALWLNNYAAAPSSASTVPEPGGLTVCVAALLTGALARVRLSAVR